jgi:phosphoribosylaminoimidazole (AIR) synthetase
MVALVDAADADAAVAVLAENGLRAWICGEVEDVAGGTVELLGDHA